MMPLKILHIQDSCTGCGACVSSCPKQALTLTYDNEGFYFPTLDVEKCVNCKICEKSCHVLKSKMPSTPLLNYKAYMLKAKDKDIVKKSSSGGAFSLLANYVLSDGGVVYGARYNFDKERLEHCSSDDCTLDELRKSKYIESFMGDTFRDVKSNLCDGRKVLFCGTPCQVEGLHRYLTVQKVDTTNLLMVRFICHGVPANQFFTEYKHYEEKKQKSKMVAFDFRPKTNGWRNSEWKMTFANGKEEQGPYYYYYYYYYFQMSNLLRRSCYSCKRVFHDIADITIGDFWGVFKYKPDYNEQDGLSVMLIHNSKSASILNLIQDNCMIEEIPQSAIKYIYGEVNVREVFFQERNELREVIVKKGYMSIAQKKLGFQIMKNRLKGFIRKKINKL